MIWFLKFKNIDKKYVSPEDTYFYQYYFYSLYIDNTLSNINVIATTKTANIRETFTIV